MLKISASITQPQEPFNKSCRMTALLACDWLGYVHVFEFLEGRGRVG